MENMEREHHTRSKATNQDFLSLPASETKQEQKGSKQIGPSDDETIDNKATARSQNDVFAMMQQMILKQDMLIERNKQFEQQMDAQNAIINGLSSMVTTLQQSNRLLELRCQR